MTEQYTGIDNVSSIITMTRALYEEAEQLLALLRTSRWHVNHLFEGVYRPTCCDVCSVATRLINFQERITRGAADLVRDVVCYVEDANLQDEAIKLYTYTLFHPTIPYGLKWKEPPAEHCLAEVLDKDPKITGPVRDTALPRLVRVFNDEYELLVREFEHWRRENPGVMVSSFLMR